jgi:peptidase E
MKKAFLASSLNLMLEHFADLAQINPKNTNTAFVDITAVPYVGKMDLFWVENDKKKFIELGYNLTKINIENESPEILNCFDTIHLCGGNTIYLLMKLHRTNWFKSIKEMVEKR